MCKQKDYMHPQSCVEQLEKCFLVCALKMCHGEKFLNLVDKFITMEKRFSRDDML